MPVKFAVICEAPADFRTASGLAVRVLREKVDWLLEFDFASCPIWFRLEGGDPFLLWKNVQHLANQMNIKVNGHYESEPGEPDARNTTRALRVLRKLDPGRTIEGILLIRDGDRQPKRRLGMEQARDQDGLNWRDRTVIGLAHLMRETWVLQGFEAVNDAERERLATLRRVLGFDPCREPWRLAAKGDHELRSAKRVLSVLTQNDLERESLCWEQTSLSMLRERGEETGLADFLDEVAERLVPAFGAGPS